MPIGGNMYSVHFCMPSFALFCLVWRVYFFVPPLVRLWVLVYPSGSTKVICPCLLHVLGGLEQLLLLVWMVALERYCDASRQGLLLGHYFLSTPFVFLLILVTMCTTWPRRPIYLPTTLGVRGKTLGVRAT